MNSVFVIAVLTAVLLNGTLSQGASFINAQSTPKASAIPNATLFLSPAKVAGLKDQTLSVDVNIADIVDLFLFQIGVRFDSTVVECLNVTEGGFLSNSGADFVLSFPGTIDNAEGLVIPYGWSLTDTTQAKSGSGTLTRFVFRMKITAYSNLHVFSFIALDKTGTDEIPVNIVDVYTPLREWSECNINIVGNAQGQTSNSEYSEHNISRGFPLQEYHRLSFNVTGSPINNNTFAFCNVSIPKNLLWANYQGLPDGGWWLLLNDYMHAIKTISENATHTSLYFEFNYNASNPTTKVSIETAIDLDHPYPKAVLSVSTDKWWYSPGETVTVKAGFTIDNVSIPAATVLLKVTYPNVSLCLSFYNITEPNGNATLNFLINQNTPLGNYTIQLLAGKLGMPGAYAVKSFFLQKLPIIEPRPGQYANYRYSQRDRYDNLTVLGWYNTSYTGYIAPNLVNCSIKFFTVGVFGNLSKDDWIGINTTTRWIPEGTNNTNSFFWLWIQTNVTISSQVPIFGGTGDVIGNRIFLFKMTDGTIGYVDCWTVLYLESRSDIYTFYFDKKTGLCVYYEEELFLLSTEYFELVDTNIPIGYKWGDINHDATVNNTDAVLMQGGWQSRTGDINYDPNMDFNLNGIINIADAALIGFNWQHRHEVLP